MNSNITNIISHLNEDFVKKIESFIKCPRCKQNIKYLRRKVLTIKKKKYKGVCDHCLNEYLLHKTSTSRTEKKVAARESSTQIYTKDKVKLLLSKVIDLLENNMILLKAANLSMRASNKAISSSQTELSKYEKSKGALFKTEFSKYETKADEMIKSLTDEDLHLIQESDQSKKRKHGITDEDIRDISKVDDFEGKKDNIHYDNTTYILESSDGSGQTLSSLDIDRMPPILERRVLKKDIYEEKKVPLQTLHYGTDIHKKIYTAKKSSYDDANNYLLTKLHFGVDISKNKYISELPSRDYDNELQLKRFHDVISKKKYKNKGPSLEEDKVVPLQNLSSDKNIAKKKHISKHPSREYFKEDIKSLHDMSAYFEELNSRKGKSFTKPIKQRSYSAEPFKSSAIDLAEKSIEHNFNYFFPKEDSVKKPLKRHKSSSEIIKEVMDMLNTRAELEKIRKENERKKKLEEQERKKQRQIEKQKRLAEKKHEMQLQVETVITKEAEIKDHEKSSHIEEKKSSTKSRTIKSEIKTKSSKSEKESLKSQIKYDLKKEAEERRAAEKDKRLKEKSEKEERLRLEKERKMQEKAEREERLKLEKERKLKEKAEKEQEKRLRDSEKENLKKETQEKEVSKPKEEKKIKEKEVSKPKEEKEIKEKEVSKPKEEKEIKEKEVSKPKEEKEIKEKEVSKPKQEKKETTKSSAYKVEPKLDVDANKLLAEQLKAREEEMKLIKKQEEETKKMRELADQKLREEAKAKLILAKQEKSPSEEKKVKEEKPKPVKTQEMPTNKELNISKIKLRRPSPDDLILRLVKIKQAEEKKRTKKPVRLSDVNLSPADVKKHEGHQFKNMKHCMICKDSDLELDVDNILYNESKAVKEPNNIIIGQKILKNLGSCIEKSEKDNAFEPILFRTFFQGQPSLKKIENEEGKGDQKPPSLSNKQTDPEAAKGIIRYALSDRSFIEKGWTMLPTEKVVRKMNVYRMRPAHPEFDWFEHNKSKKLMTYDTGEKLAEFDDNGKGSWFYRNGRKALDYYDAEEINAQQRFVVYSNGEPDERGRGRPFTILATFDYLGNGIVFDHSGKIRLKYNQTEGVVLDRNIGPASHWKWHTLNDPPVLQQVMIDTQLAHKDPDILKLGGPHDDKPRHDNEEMLAIEFDNFIKEKSKKLSQKFKPFQIKMKALKINENFSLKVLDQATVYLIFRDGSTNLKLNLGMILDHKEIVDTDTAEVGVVSNSLERFPARTDSLAGLQQSVSHAQRVERARVERERRLRPTQSCASADKMTAGASRPLRHPFRTVPSDATSTVECRCRCRKPSSNNVYYDTRLF